MSPLARQAAQAKDSTIKCAADQIESRYFITRNEIVNDMCEQLQELIASITNSKQLTDFDRVSHQATTDFIKYVSDQITTKIQLKIKNFQFDVYIDESTDVATLNQVVKFIRYLDENRHPQTSFLDLRPFSSKGVTVQNLYETFIQVSVDHGLNLDDLIGICVDGASAMIDSYNSMTSKLKDRYSIITIVHWYAHRLNLASLDAIKRIDMQPLRTCEAVTQQL
ncbi:MAG: hypothetical protein EZS28_026924 [Streblomastix strix]|uniref:Uncharacterized protein n=1 Tax=Streblomastix strix TaxID=222440 RepID=A0A5J4V472_9EUKA|nr:MAG: hypothetical protein EZS28_026924 [Streblomastix strix]